jgi:hypothetical protein
VAILRHAMRQHQMRVKRDVFVLLLARIEAANGFWARQTVRRMAGIAPETVRMVEEDLVQELALHLWEELALREGEGWELFFRRAIVFARAHVARRYLERHSYRPGQRLVLFFSEIAASADDSAAAAPPLLKPRDPFTASDLAARPRTRDRRARRHGAQSTPQGTYAPLHTLYTGTGSGTDTVRA